MRSERWHTVPVPFETIRTLANALGTSDITATVLARRGYGEPEAARKFLSSEGHLHDPFFFPDMVAVRDRIRSAIRSGEEICIHGDYDVDGITSTVLLVEVLRHLGARVSCHLPNRFSDGYGITGETIEAIVARGTGLLITVDCGISAREPLKHARDAGVDVIVVDHHQPGAELPEALIISPLVCNYPFKELAGVGLAFKLAQALVEHESGPSAPLPDLLQKQLDLVALGTIADVVPLLDENRSLVKRGLPQLARTMRPGLIALMEQALVEPDRLNTGMVAFRLAPRINAAGRLDDPAIALDLLLAEDNTAAVEAARQLESLNRERQRLENRMLADAQELVGGLPEALRAARGFVLSSANWHEGVIGIVASKMVELHNRPVIMVAESEGFSKGSGRSIAAFDLYGSLTALRSHLVAFGGHKAACGLTIETSRLAEFQQAFAEYASGELDQSDLQPSRFVDALVSGRELTLDLAEELSLLEPFGMGNPSIDLLAPGARIIGCKTTRDGSHLQCQVESGGARSKAIGFGKGHLAEKISASPKWDVVFRLEQNEFRGSVSPQLKLGDLFPHEHECEDTPGLCESRCDFGCGERIKGEEFWRLVQSDSFIPEAWVDPGKQAAAESEELRNRLIDRRNQGGIHGLVTMLASCGENILLLSADVARRRSLVTEELYLARRSAGGIVLASSRCGHSHIEAASRLLAENPSGILLADFFTLSENPLLARGFDHIVFVDPPFSRTIFNHVAALAPQAFLHLFYCLDEVQFTQKVLEHEFQLRAPLKKVFRHLRAGDRNPIDDTTERLLLAGGRYLRQPALAGRCLRVLEELGLVRVSMDGADREILLQDAGDIELGDSATYRKTSTFYEECSSFLSKSLNVKMT